MRKKRDSGKRKSVKNRKIENMDGSNKPVNGIDELLNIDAMV